MNGFFGIIKHNIISAIKFHNLHTFFEHLITKNMSTKKSVALYARVSTDKQAVEMQTKELNTFVKNRGWLIFNTYIDQGYSGKNTKRPAYNQMMKDAYQKKFEVVLVWKLDRLSRSVKDLINTLDVLSSLGIDFVSYSDGEMDTTTPTGRLVFNVIAVIAEFEKEIIRERVKAGLNNAKSKGKRLGRPPIPYYIKNRAIELHNNNKSIREISKILEISIGSVSSLIKIKK